MTSPLIVTRDQNLRDELLRLAAATGVTPEVVDDAARVPRAWSQASLVLVGVDVVADVARLGLTRRAGLHIVGWGGVPDEVFRLAVTVGAENVAELPRSDAWVLEMLAESVDGPEGKSLTLGVVGGSGGSGATTFACALGLAAALRGPACLIDADCDGPGVDRVLGFDRMDGVRWDALQQTTGRISARALRDALPRRHGLGVLTWAPGSPATLQPFALREAMAAAARGHDTVVVDLPRGAGGLSDELLARCDQVLLVVRGTVPGLASAARVSARIRGGCRLSIVLRGSGIDAREAARAVGSPVLHTMTDQRGLEEAVDLGLGPMKSRRSVLARAADRVLDMLSAEPGSLAA